MWGMARPRREVDQLGLVALEHRRAALGWRTSMNWNPSTCTPLSSTRFSGIRGDRRRRRSPPPRSGRPTAAPAGAGSARSPPTGSTTTSAPLGSTSRERSPGGRPLGGRSRSVAPTTPPPRASRRDGRHRGDRRAPATQLHRGQTDATPGAESTPSSSPRLQPGPPTAARGKRCGGRRRTRPPRRDRCPRARGGRRPAPTTSSSANVPTSVVAEHPVTDGDVRRHRQPTSTTTPADSLPRHEGRRGQLSTRRRAPHVGEVHRGVDPQLAPGRRRTVGVGNCRPRRLPERRTNGRPWCGTVSLRRSRRSAARLPRPA